MKWLWCNGRWVETLDFPGVVTDRGLMHGLGLFETILAVDGRPIFAERHLARLQRSCAQLGWSFELDDPKAIMTELIHLNELEKGRARIRLAISGGSGPIHDLSPTDDHMVWILSFSVPEVPLSCAVNLSQWVRNERSPLAGLKCSSYAENVIALAHSRQLGFEETLFFNTVGQLCEAATANVFLVRRGVLLTPPVESGCLPGITRAVVIELAARLGIACKQRALNADDLESADELFLTSSIRGVMEVSRLGDRKLDPGEVTRRLRDAWNAVISGKSEC